MAAREAARWCSTQALAAAAVARPDQMWSGSAMDGGGLEIWNFLRLPAWSGSPRRGDWRAHYHCTGSGLGDEVMGLGGVRENVSNLTIVSSRGRLVMGTLTR